MMIDVTEKEEREELRKEFSANVSHELKTPLTTISGYAELMKDGLVKQEDVGRFSEKIYTEARRLISMIEGIIKLSRLDENQIVQEKEEIDLYQITLEIKNSLSMKAAESGIDLHVLGSPCTGGRGIRRQGRQAALHRLHGPRMRQLPRNGGPRMVRPARSEEHTSELQSQR